MHTATSPRWQTLPCDDAAASSLAAALGVAPLVARLLCQRGLADADAAARFLNPSLDQLHSDGVHLVISVDCGIRGTDAARRARELGIDLIITDHHEPDTTLPPALAVINPKRTDCSYPDKYLAGVGVALKLVQALCREAHRDSWLLGFI